MKFFVYDNVNNEVALEDESLFLIKEFKNLLDPKRNITKTDKTGKKKERAFKEFKFIYLFFDWKSPYFQYSEQDRYNEAVKDSELTVEEFNDPVFKEACKKYDNLQNSSIDIKLLKSALLAVEKVAYYLENVDTQERDPATGKPIFKTKDVLAEIKGCKDLINGLRDLESQVKKGLEVESNIRGGTEVGMFD